MGEEQLFFSLLAKCAVPSANYILCLRHPCHVRRFLLWLVVKAHRQPKGTGRAWKNPPTSFPGLRMNFRYSCPLCPSYGNSTHFTPGVSHHFYFMILPFRSFWDFNLNPIHLLLALDDCLSSSYWPRGRLIFPAPKNITAPVLCIVKHAAFRQTLFSPLGPSVQIIPPQHLPLTKNIYTHHTVSI